jgi:Zn-dependent peptidase ImmA (M78 family)/transcriptional regulator with XRE-family HTH domain
MGDLMVYGERVRQAREIRGLTQRELAGDIGKDKSLIAQVEVGVKAVSDDLLGLVATATKFPISFFMEPPLTEFPVSGILFRARSNVSRKALIEAARNAEHVFNVGLSLARQCKRLSVLLPVSQQQSPIVCARATKKAMNVDPNIPIPNLIRTLERIGVWVIALPNLEGRDAFCVWARDENEELPVIAYSSGSPSGDRQRLSIAHEIGHLVMHRTCLKSPAVMEAEAYQFGAELLMPEAAMRAEMRTPFTLTSAARLKPRWGVSVQALIRRAHDLQIITERQYRYLFYQLSAHGWRIREPRNLDVAVEKPRLLRKLAETVYGFPINHEEMASASHIRAGELKSILAMYADKTEVGGTSDSNVSPNVVSFPRAEARLKK